MRGYKMDYITLPAFDWFCPDIERPYTFNTFSASRGTDPDQGCIENLTINYKLKIIVEDDKPTAIHVSFRIIHPWPHPVNEGRVGENSFECSPEGLVAAKKWLTEEFINMYRLGG